MKTKIKLLTCLLLLTACSQETATAPKIAAIPAVVKKIELTKKPNSDKEMMLNSTGIDLIKFGASLEDVKKILNYKQIKTDQISDDGNTLLFTSEVLNVDGIPVPRLFLRFNPKNLFKFH